MVDAAAFILDAKLSKSYLYIYSFIEPSLAVHCCTTWKRRKMKNSKKTGVRKYHKSENPRLRWTPELHEYFVEVVEGLGGKNSEFFFLHVHDLGLAIWFLHVHVYSKNFFFIFCCLDALLIKLALSLFWIYFSSNYSSSINNLHKWWLSYTD